MRLTLRTMLAYLDDVLEPADAKDIGSKIETSEFAANLVHRVRDVSRRPRLGAPKLQGRGALDPNTVAEYLDNVLTNERVPDFEKVCLESDVHLAEVAGSHQILALVLGEPAEVETSARQRMYSLLAMHEQELALARDGGGNGRASAAASDADEDPHAAAAEAAAAARHSPEVPEYLREESSGGRWWALAAGAAVAVGLVIAVVMAIDPSLFERIAGRQPRPAPVGDGAVAVGDGAAVDGAAVNGAAVDGAGTAAESETPNGGAAAGAHAAAADDGRTVGGEGADAPRPQAGDGAAPDSDNRGPGAQVEAGARGSAATASVPGATAAIDPLGAAPAPAPAAPATAPTDPPAPAASVPAQPGAPAQPGVGDVAAARVPAAGVDPFPARAPATNPPTTNPPTTNPPTTNPPTTNPPTINPPAGGANPSAGTLAGSAPLANPATDREVMGQLVSSTPLFRFNRADRRYDLLPVLATLSPGDQLYSPPLFRNSMSLQGGLTAYLLGNSRLQLQRISDLQLPVFDFPYGRLVLTTANDLETRVQLRLPGHTGVLNLVDAASTVAIEVRPARPMGGDPEQSPQPLSATIYAAVGKVSWEENGNTTVLQSPAVLRLGAAAPPSASEPPDWLRAEPVSQLDRKAMEALSAELRQSDPTKMDQALLELADSRRFEVRSLAIRTLTGLGRFDPALASLSDASLRSFWGSHIEDVRQQLALSPERAAEVRGAWSRIRPRDAAALYRLFWGYSNDQLNGGKARELVEYLDHSEMNFRVLAAWNLRDITGVGSILYRPEATEAQRKPFVLKWRQRLEAGQIVHAEPNGAGGVVEELPADDLPANGAGADEAAPAAADRPAPNSPLREPVAPNPDSAPAESP